MSIYFVYSYSNLFINIQNPPVAELTTFKIRLNYKDDETIFICYNG